MSWWLRSLEFLKELGRRVHQQTGEMYATAFHSHPEREFSRHHGRTACGVMTLPCTNFITSTLLRERELIIHLLEFVGGKLHTRKVEKK
jgi:hypothetical protein